MIADYEPKERKPLVLKGYSIKDHHYDHYDNYDALNVDKCTDIPIDYDGVIGVPITISNYLWEDGKIHCVYANETIPKKATPKSDYVDNVKKNLIFLSGKQFMIVGLGIANLGLEMGVKPYKAHHKQYRKEVQKRGQVDGDLYMVDEQDHPIVPYARICIKRVS